MNRNRIATRQLRWALLAAIVLIPGCALFGQKKEAEAVAEGPLDYRYVITLKADKDINPNRDGKPTPVLLNLYELRTGGNFEMADYFDLRDHAATRLGADFVGGDKLMIWPGTEAKRSYPAGRGKHAIGVIAGYQRLENRTWRVLIPMTPPEAPKFYQPSFYRFWGSDVREVQINVSIRKDGLHVESPQTKASLPKNPVSVQSSQPSVSVGRDGLQAQGLEPGVSLQKGGPRVQNPLPN